MLKADQGQTPDLDGSDLRIAVVASRFNDALMDKMVDACLDELTQLGVDAKNVRLLRVPGALEIPVTLKALAESETYDALIALGCVIRGATYHFELVANESAAGVTRVALDHLTPIANAILTVETEDQALERVSSKARDAARVAVEMANLLDDLL